MSDPSYPAAPAPRPSTETGGKATASMVLGIVGLVLAIPLFPVGVILGILGLIFGILAKRGGGPNQGRATAGLVTSIIALVLGIIVGIFVVWIIADNADEIGDYVECLDDAAGDPAAEAECDRIFDEQFLE